MLDLHNLFQGAWTLLILSTLHIIDYEPRAVRALKHMCIASERERSTAMLRNVFYIRLSHQSSAATTAVIYSPSPTIYPAPDTLFQLRDSDEGAIGCELAPLFGENED